MSRLSIFVVLLAVVPITWSQPSCSKNHNFDYILLATQWPETFCETVKCVPHSGKWAIHGAWPQNNDNTWPQNCCTDHPFNVTTLEPIEPELIAHWKTLKAGSSNNQFWSHEYTKHGTCAVDSPLLKTELAYFNNTLVAFKKLKLDQWLSDAAIVPSPSRFYAVSAFHSAIKKALGHEVQIDCATHRIHGYPVISQINLCLNKQTLEPFDCPKHDGCDPRTHIGYPRV